jgi:hypothetical protein
VSTAGYVKLLLPPRQSRGNSHWGLGNAHLRCKSYIDDARTACGALFESEGDTDTPNGSMSVPARLGADGEINVLYAAQDAGHEVTALEALRVTPVSHLVVAGAVDVVEYWTGHPSLGQTPEIMKIVTVAQVHACSQSQLF